MNVVEEQVLNMSKENQTHNNNQPTANNNILRMKQSWKEDSRWSEIIRPYSAEDVSNLQGSLPITFSFAQAGAERLWNLLNSKEYII